MNPMIRTQIYIPETIHTKLQRLAEANRQPMAEVIRQFIEDGLRNTRQDTSGKTTIKNLLQIQATGGPTDLSTNLDHYLYGGPKQTDE
jgi:predicted transcriptional regulator